MEFEAKMGSASNNYRNDGDLIAVSKMLELFVSIKAVIAQKDIQENACEKG